MKKIEEKLHAPGSCEALTEMRLWRARWQGMVAVWGGIGVLGTSLGAVVLGFILSRLWG